MKKEKINLKVETILNSKNLWKRIIQEEGKKIAGEINAKEQITLCCFGTLVKNASYSSFNLLTHSISSTGKDYTTDNILKLFPTGTTFKRTRITPSALNYWQPTETWEGCILYLPDISESIMNCEALKLMCSEGSFITIVDVNLKPKDIEIKGKPVIISTTANTTPTEEMLNRFGIIPLTETQEQTKEILKLQSKYAKEGSTIEYNQDILDAIKILSRHKVKIPFADKIAVTFPTEQVKERRNFNRFLDFIKAITCLYQFQRKEDKGFLISTYDDYDLARKVYMNSQRGLISLPLNNLHKRIIETLKENKDGLTITEISSKMENPLSRQGLFPHLNSLINLKVLQIEEKQDFFNVMRKYYKISPEYYKFKPTILPTSKELQRII